MVRAKADGGMLPRMGELAEHGYASMAISLAPHGDSDGTSFDFGFRAERDVIAAVHYLHGRFPGRPVVVAGNSLGSVSAIFAAGKLDHEVAGYFLESPYRDLLTAVKNRTEFVPPPFSESAYVGLRMWGRVLLTEDPSQVRPIDHVAEIPADIPITFLAARGDRLCRLFEVEDLDRKVAAHANLIEVESCAARRDLADRSRDLLPAVAWRFLRKLTDHTVEPPKRSSPQIRRAHR